MVRSFEVLNELTFPTLRETNPVLTERLRRSRALRTGTLPEYEVYARHPERPANVSGQSRQTQIMISYCHRDAHLRAETHVIAFGKAWKRSCSEAS
jgi:hypothetical protein